MNKAIYPGTFDPITRGHEDLARRASRLYDQVILAIAGNSSKKPFFTLEERVSMAQQVLIDCPNIEVTSFTGLLMKFAQQQNVRIIVRGLRAASDFEYEFQMAGMNRSMYPDVETVFMTPSEQHMFTSATIVREISLLGGNADKFLHPLVATRLRTKNLKLVLLSVESQ